MEAGDDGGGCPNLDVTVTFSIHELKSQSKRGEGHLHSLPSETGFIIYTSSPHVVPKTGG